MSNLSVAVRVSADASQAEAGFARGTAAVDQFTGSLAQAGAAAASQAAEAQRAAQQAAQAGQQQASQAQAQAQTRAVALQQLGEAEQRYAQAVIATNRALAAREIDDRQAQGTLQRARRELDGYRDAVDRQGKSAENTAYRNKLLAMQFSDTFQSIARGMPIQQVLLQQGPQIADAYGGIGVVLKALISPVGLAVAGFAALAATGLVLVSRLEGSERALNAAAVGLTATGRASELSRAQLQALTDQFTKLPGATRSGAEQSVAALSRMRQVSVQLFGEIGAAASNFMVLTGTDFPQASAELSEYLKAPTEGAKKFADAWGGLSVAQLDAIESMDRSGNRLGAQRELLAAMQTRLQDLAKVGRTEIQQASDTMGKSWDDMLTKLSRTGPIVAAREALISLFKGVASAASESSLDDQIAELDRKLANPPVLSLRPDGTPIYDRGRADYVDARRRREQLDLQRQARDAAGFNEAEAFSFNRPGNRPGTANDNGLPDPTKIKELIGVYDDLATRRRALLDQMALLSRAAGQEGVDQDALSRALQNLMGQYDALKDPIDKARDALADDQRVAAASIGTRQILQAQLQAERAALDAGVPSWKAKELGQAAAAQATVQLSTAARDQVVLAADEAKGALTVASAYLQGARAASQATIAEEARQAAVKNAFVDEQALTAALTARAAAQATIGGAKAVAELQQRVDATERLAEAEKAGAAAVTEAGIANEVAAYALQLRATETDKTRDANDRLIESYERLLRRQADGERSQANSQALRSRQEQIELAEAELRLVGALPPEHDRQIERLRTIQDLRRRGVDLTSDQAQAELRLTDQLTRIETQTQQARNAAAETSRTWDQAASNIQDALSDAFMSAFDRSKSGGFDAAATLLRIFKSVAAEIASAMVIKPVIGSVAGMLGAPQSWLYDRGYSQAGGGSSIPQSAMSWLNPFSDNPFGIAGGFSNILNPGAGWLGSMFPSVFGAGVAPVLGLEAGAASMGAAGLGLTAAEATTLGAGSAAGSLASLSGLFSVGLPIAAAIAIPLLSGMFADEQTPRGYAASEIRPDGRFIASTQHQAGLDGYDNSRDRQQAAQFSAMMNSTVQRLGLNLAVSRDSINANGATNGLLTIGTMYGGAASADELFMRWFTRNQNQASSGDTSETAWMRASGYSRSGTYDRDTGWSYTLADGNGATVTQEMWDQAYSAWVDKQKAAATTSGASLFKAEGNATLQTALDRMASGAYKPADSEELGKALDFAAGFEDQVKRSAAGVGTLQRQLLEFQLAARDTAKALNQQVKDYLDQAKKIFGEGSTQAQQAQQSQLQSVLGQMGIGPNAGSEPLDGLAATIQQTIAGFEAMAPVLVTLGQTSAEAAATIAQATTQYRQKVASEYNKSVSDAILGFKAPEKLAWAQLAEAQSKQWKEAQAAGADMAKIAELQALQTQALFDQFQQQRQARLDSLSQRVYAVDATLNPANARANEDAVRKIQQRREAEDLTRGLEKAEADVLRQRLAEIHAAEDLAVKLARLEEDRQKAEGYMARSANALAGVMTGSAGEQQAKALAEDVSRALAQAQ
ncbi:MAG: phage tail length tape measure family protein, partial [Ferrovibrionaceae bacterium]